MTIPLRYFYDDIWCPYYGDPSKRGADGNKLCQAAMLGLREEQCSNCPGIPPHNQAAALRMFSMMRHNALIYGTSLHQPEELTYEDLLTALLQ